MGQPRPLFVYFPFSHQVESNSDRTDPSWPLYPLDHRHRLEIVARSPEMSGNHLGKAIDQYENKEEGHGFKSLRCSRIFVLGKHFAVFHSKSVICIISLTEYFAEKPIFE